jgi:mono/diheme cytochrome c family protein
MKLTIRIWSFLATTTLLVAAPVALAQAAKSGRTPLHRGEYLSILGGCNDCHSPKLMTPNGPALDPEKILSGHPATEQLPAVPSGVLGPGHWMAMTNDSLTAWVGPWGTSFAANLTPDAETGMGRWTLRQFIQTMRTGKHLGFGRPVLPPMPTLAALTDADLKALFSYLKSLKPVRNLVPAPVPPKGPEGH